MNVINLAYDSTNYYLVQSNSGWIMIDTGWPGTLPKYLNLLKQRNIRLGEVKYLMVTHFHPDHAGLVQDIKDYGISLILHNCQAAYIDELKELFKGKPQYKFKDINSTNNIIVTSAESRALLKGIGIDGEIIPTPGHSNDSVSLVIDGCCGFTGDLTGLQIADVEGNPEIKASWGKIQKYKVKVIYPGHGYAYSLDMRD